MNFFDLFPAACFMPDLTKADVFLPRQKRIQKVTINRNNETTTTQVVENHETTPTIEAEESSEESTIASP